MTRLLLTLLLTIVPLAAKTPCKQSDAEIDRLVPAEYKKEVELAKLEVRIWELEIALDKLKKTRQTPCQCDCRVRCRGKKAREAFEDLEIEIEDVRDEADSAISEIKERLGM